MNPATIVTAVELGAFIAQVVTTIVDRFLDASARGKDVTVQDLHAATEEAIDGWNKAKARHWRRVEQLADEAEAKKHEP